MLSVGKIPANTIGFTSLKPGRAASAVTPPRAWVSVSPTFVSCTLLMFAAMKPTSPACSASSATAHGWKLPISVTSYSVSVDRNLMRSPFLSEPSTTRSMTIAPR